MDPVGHSAGDRFASVGGTLQCHLDRAAPRIDGGEVHTGTGEYLAGAGADRVLQAGVARDLPAGDGKGGMAMSKVASAITTAAGRRPLGLSANATRP